MHDGYDSSNHLADWGLLFCLYTIRKVSVIVTEFVTNCFKNLRNAIGILKVQKTLVEMSANNPYSYASAKHIGMKKISLRKMISPI